MSPEYLARLERVDAALGMVLAALSVEEIFIAR
jgi:hypothetical protein